MRISGSGDVSGSGSAGKLAITIAGSGDVRLTELRADDVNISIAGSGDAAVNAQKTLSVRHCREIVANSYRLGDSFKSTPGELRSQHLAGVLAIIGSRLGKSFRGKTVVSAPVQPGADVMQVL